jgi:hypothetical protein
MTGTELRQGTDNSQHQLLFTDENANPSAPDGCASTDHVMSFSVTMLPFYFLRDF